MSQEAASPNAETLDTKDRRERAEKALAVVNEAAHTVSNLYITFLLLGTYSGIIITSTTDEQLLRISPVTLPPVACKRIESMSSVSRSISRLRSRIARISRSYALTRVRKR
jgi:hypothetical protein